MAIRDLMVVLNGSPRDDAVLAMALGLALRHDAHLTGIAVLEHLIPAEMSLAMGGYPDMWAAPEFVQQMEARANAAAAIIEARFRESLRRDGARGEWVLETDALTPALSRRARVTDLVVMGQTDPDNPPSPTARHLPEDVLMTAGRPLLLVPYAGTFAPIGHNVLIGWTNTREAARAVHDALPLFQPGGKVTVLTAEDSGYDIDTVPGAELADHLARHALTVASDRTVVTAAVSAADALLDYASDSGADLLVVGGYGHSRTREMIMGGVTRALLRHMTLPVLMSH